jgi:hypothetical protein
MDWEQVEVRIFLLLLLYITLMNRNNKLCYEEHERFRRNH